jgi:3-hydroxyacyl-[acyl-carrier-protein] dehydratase
MSLTAIKAAIPHREPFLLLDEIVEQSAERIVCRKHFTGDEFWYRGHYPHFPITPGVLLCEAAMQAGAVLLAGVFRSDESSTGKRVSGTVSCAGGQEMPSCEMVPDPFFPVATRANNVQFKQMVLPGDTIEIEVELVEQMSTAYFLKARVTTQGKVACRFEFACTMVTKQADDGE